MASPFSEQFFDLEVFLELFSPLFFEQGILLLVVMPKRGSAPQK
jgi:hypothetical protein